MMPNGHPQSSIVWCDLSAEGYVRVNTTKERQKGRNMIRNPKISIVVIDPEDSGRFIELRGDVEITGEGALEHLDVITRQYTDKNYYYGEIFPIEQKEKETRIICNLKPQRIVMNAIHY